MLANDFISFFAGTAEKPSIFPFAWNLSEWLYMTMGTPVSKTAVILARNLAVYEIRGDSLNQIKKMSFGWWILFGALIPRRTEAGWRIMMVSGRLHIDLHKQQTSHGTAQWTASLDTKQIDGRILISIHEQNNETAQTKRG